MPAVSAVSILAMSGRSSSRQASESGAAGEVVERDQRAALAVLVRPSSCSSSRSGQRSGWMISRQIRDGSAPRRPTTGQVVRIELSTSSDRARVEVDEQDLALGQQRQADLERRGAGAVVEGEERVVGLGGGHQLGAAQLDRAELAAHQRLAAEGDGRWSGRRSAGSAARICPCERNSGNQSVRVRSSSVSAGHRAGACSSASRTANRHARSETDSALMTDFSRSSQPGPASSESLHGDIARGGLGGEVLDLVED